MLLESCVLIYFQHTVLSKTKVLSTLTSYLPYLVLLQVQCHHMAFSKNLKKQNYHIIQKFLFQIYNHKNWEQSLEQMFLHSCPQQLYSQQPKGGSNPRVHQWTNGQTRCGMYIQCNSIQPLKRKKILIHITSWTNREDLW